MSSAKNAWVGTTSNSCLYHTTVPSTTEKHCMQQEDFDSATVGWVTAVLMLAMEPAQLTYSTWGVLKPEVVGNALTNTARSQRMRTVQRL